MANLSSPIPAAPSTIAMIVGLVAGMLSGCNESSAPPQPSAQQAPAQPASAPPTPAPPTPGSQAWADAEAAREAQARKGADDAAWAAALRAGTTAALYSYIQSFGLGAHVAEARQRIAALEVQARKDADDKAWDEALRAGTAEAITAYVQKFGTGAHVAQARQRLATLEQQGRKDADDKAWDEALRAGTAEALTGYVQKFGAGAHVAEARRRLAALDAKARKDADDKAWADASGTNNAAAYSAYLQKFGSGAHAAEARGRLAALAAKARKDADALRKALAAIPVIDIKKTCRTAAGVSGYGSLAGTSGQKETDSCLKSEQDARETIAKQWAQFTATDRSRCVTPGVYLPSYVEWLTCLEMERDVRVLKRQPTPPTPSTPSTAAKPAPALARQ